MAKVAIVGATGMVGRAATRRLIADGHEVTAIVRDPSRAAAALPAQARPSRGDVEDAGSLGVPLADAEAMVIIMPLSVEEPGSFNAERDGTRNVLDALPSRPVRIVKLSEIGAGTDSAFRDLEAKAKAEEAILASGHPHVILRPTWFMEAWIGQLRAGPDFLAVGESERAIHWVSLDDMAMWLSASVTSAEAEGRTLTAQGRDALTIHEAARRLADASGRRVVKVPVEAVRPPGAPEGLAATLQELFRYYDRTPEAFEADDLWRILGRPTVGFDDFVARVVPELQPEA